MSFWRSQGWFNSSPINKLLDNGTIALTEIFEQDDIISELKTNNKKLIDYLKLQRNIDTMIEYLTLETETEEESRKYKYPWIVAEILSADTAVVDALLENEESYLRLLNFLFSPQLKKTSPFLTTYVCKVFGFLIAKNSTKVIESLKVKENEIANFFDNIDNSSVLELLLKIIASDISEHSLGVSDWLLKVKLIENFIEKLTPENTYNSHENISQFVSSVISLSLQVPYSPLLDHLRDEKIISRVFEVIRNNLTTTSTNLEEFYSSIKFGVCVVNDIVKLFLTNSVYDNNTPLDRIPSTLSICLKQIDLFNSLLQTSTQKSSEIETTFGKIVPLGSHRLQLVELLQSLCASRYSSIYALFIESDLFATLYNLFFEYPWNNLLHIMVAQMTQNVLDSGNEILIHQLLQTTKVHVQLANAGISSVDKESKRLGLMGIVSKLATSIQNVNYPSVIELLEESEEWEEYINGDFLETKKKENTPIGKSSQSEDEPSDDQSNEEMKLFQSRTKRNFEITFPDDFAVGDFDDKDLEVYFLAKDEKHFQGINTDEEGLDVFAEFV